MVVMEVGTKFNRLTLISYNGEKNSDNRRIALYKCECGNEKKLPISRVKSGVIKSCGCIVGKNIKHGMKGSRTYDSWIAAKNRCNCPTSKDFPRYGGKGITFHGPWCDSFEQFLKDMGERPPGTTLDRIDNSKGYTPINCRWATRSEQQRNKTTSYIWEINGEIFGSAEEAAVKYSVTAQTIHKWVLGWKDNRRNKVWGAKDGCSRIRKY